MKFSEPDIQHYVEKKQSGTDYSVIRKELETKGMSKDQISEFIREVDKIILEDNTGSSSKVKMKEAKIIGYVLLFGGGFVTLATYFNWINLNGLYIFAWGPILSGYLLILISRVANKKRTRTFGGK